MGFSRQEYWSGLPFPSPYLFSSVQFSHSVVSDSLQPHGLQPPRLLCPWNSPGKNTGVGSHSRFFSESSTKGLNPGLLYCRQILYHLSHQGSPISDNIKTRFHLNSIKCYGRKQVSYMCRSSFNTMTITDF